METPTPNLASERLIALGSYHLTALDQDDATRALIASLEPAQRALEEAAAARLAADAALVAPRVVLRFAEARVEAETRAFAAAAHLLDGAANGPVHKLIFPDGLDAEIAPRAQSQVDATRALLLRIETLSVAAPIRSEALPRLQRANESLAAAVARRDASIAASETAIAREYGARESFCRAYDASAGHIRALFPRDARRQDLFFDAVRTPRAAKKGEPPAT